MLTKTKITIVAALVFGCASGAMAQSYDPDIGTGNIVLVSGQNVLAHVKRGPLAAHAQVRMSIVPTVGPNGEIHISAARAAALRECSAIAAQYPEYDWGNMEIYQYRACMVGHGQVE